RARRQVDVVKVMASGGMNTAGTDVMRTQFSVAEMTLLVDRAHAAGLPVTAHAHGLPAVMQAIDVGADGIEHCSCLTDKGVELSLELADRLAASKVVIGGFIPVPPITDLSQAPPGIREMMQKTGLTPERLTQMRLTWLGRLIGSGVRLTTGPDSGINAYVQHGHLHKAVKFLVDAGASHQQALAGATSVAAQACSVDDRKGLLRAGYDSDVLVVNGDLQEDVGALAAVRTVILGGSIVS
ncbi:MAG: amidohydrolase family protein, partial [Nakamurella sp.]